MDRNMDFLLWNMTGDNEPYPYGLEQNGSQHDNALWNVIGVNESYWYIKELNESQCEGFNMKHYERR